MAKFCTSCGAQIADDAGFCTSCGAPQNNTAAPNMGGMSNMGTAPNMGMPYQSQQPQPSAVDNFAAAAGNAAHSAGEAVKNTFDGVTFDSVKGAMTMDNIKNVGTTKNKNTIIGLCAIFAAIIIVIIILAVAISSASAGYKKPIASLCNAVQNTDGQELSDVFPDYINDNMEKYMSDDYDSVEEYYEEELLEDLLDNLEDKCGSNIKIKYKITKKKEIDESDLDDMEDTISDYYDEDVNISKGYKLKVELTVKGKKKDRTDSEWIEVYKIDGKWCITDFSALA